MRPVRLLSAFVVCALFCLPLCFGQWSGDPAANLVIADRSDEQVQPKVVATADGGFYVSWFDNATGGYDVYLQRLDAAGVEQWPHNGVLVADRGYGWTQEYGLAVDTADYALLAFGDGSVEGEEVRVARVDPDGNLVWGPDGVQVATGIENFSPRVAGTSDGNIVVAWTQDGTIAVQKLDPDGNLLWGTGVTLSPPPSDFYMLSDLRSADAGTVIVSFVYQPVFMTNHLYAQKLAAADGALLWGASHVAVFDAGSLQMGNFPPFVSDGEGGAVFAWYLNSNPPPYFLQCRVQHVLANGTEAFAHQGVDVSTYPTRQRVNPSAAFLPATDEVVVFWSETDEPQGQFGLYGQKLDASGVRQWTDNGVELVPLGGNQISWVVTLPFGDGALVAWVDSMAFGNEPLRGTRVDTDGNFVWATPIVDLATSPTGRSRLTGELSTVGYAAYAWQDGDFSTYDIPAQNLNGDGSLGRADIFSDGFESGDTSAWSATVP